MDGLGELGMAAHPVAIAPTAASWAHGERPAAGPRPAALGERRFVGVRWRGLVRLYVVRSQHTQCM